VAEAAALASASFFSCQQPRADSLVSTAPGCSRPAERLAIVTAGTRNRGFNGDALCRAAPSGQFDALTTAAAFSPARVTLTKLLKRERLSKDDKPT
jgi:hypothetical protein